jgi:diguanylate cyclase (GGDEF)-like protein
VTSIQQDLAPLRPRLGALFILRLGLAAASLAAAVVLPGTPSGGHERLAYVVAGYLVVSVLVETIRQWRASLPIGVIGLAVLVDGLFLATAVTVSGGLGGSLTFLLYVHLIAVTLLASYRTGLKVAVWQSLLLVVAHYLPPSLTGTAPLAPADAVFTVLAFLTVAVTTGFCSALNERELRRSRAGFQALAQMAGAMEDAQNPDEVVATLLRTLPGYMGSHRAAVYLRAEQTMTTLDGDRVTSVAVGDTAPGVVRHCWERRGPVLVKQLDGDKDRDLDAALPRAANVVVVPLSADGEATGALLVERGGGNRAHISAGVVGMLTQFAAHAALAHRNVRLMAEIKHLATVDGLTGLANRRTFEAALQREVARSLRSGDELSLLLLDIDHFKKVNDDHGHPMGDEVLRHVGRVLATHGRELDLPARYGGEEFAVILPGCPLEEAMGVAERLRAALALDGPPVPVTASAGIAAMHRNATDAHGLVKAADEALYAAKTRGRNRTEAAEARRLRAVGA